MAGHVAPEAVKGGPIAAIREGDEISFDVEARRLDVALSDEEIARRVAEYESPPPPFERGVMAKYAAAVGLRGAGCRHRLNPVRNSSSSWLKRAGRSICGTWPVRSNSSSRESGIRRW